MRLHRPIAELMAIPRSAHDMDWLKDSLQSAIELEFATIPPYLCAYWSVKNPFDTAALSIKTVVREEMLHFGLACNLLTAIGGSPSLNQKGAVPVYPGKLPGGVIPNLKVSLAGLSKPVLELFMAIERPEFPPVGLVADAAFASIGEFYAAIQSAFEKNNPAISLQRQLDGPLGLHRLHDLQEVKTAIVLIMTQGEGSDMNPEEAPGDLAHYYRFAELYHGRKFIKQSDGRWGYSGPVIPFPDVWPMATVPEGGYLQDKVPAAVRDNVLKFDQRYTTMLNQLQDAWDNGNDQSLVDSTATMFSMSNPAVALMKVPIQGGSGTYGPCFRLV